MIASEMPRRAINKGGRSVPPNRYCTTARAPPTTAARSQISIDVKYAKRLLRGSELFETGQRVSRATRPSLVHLPANERRDLEIIEIAARPPLRR